MVRSAATPRVSNHEAAMLGQIENLVPHEQRRRYLVGTELRVNRNAATLEPALVDTSFVARQSWTQVQFLCGDANLETLRRSDDDQKSVFDNRDHCGAARAPR